jgi:hypothetical protein
MQSRGVGWTLLALAAVASEPPDAAAETLSFELGQNVLQVDRPTFEGLVAGTATSEQVRAYWGGEVEGSQVRIDVRVLPKDRYYISYPEETVEYVGSLLRDPKYGGHPAFAYANVEQLKGAFGWLPYASLGVGPIPNAVDPAGEVMILSGVLDKHAYAVYAETKPALRGKARDDLLAFLRKGVRATGVAEDPRWTAEEIRVRWEKDVPDPEVRASLRAPVRTAHYLILTDSGAGALFAKKMESFYQRIQKVFPFPEIEGRRLMPVFLFKDRGAYVGFSTKSSSWSREEAEGTKGHAYRDYYATYYDSPNDPVHIHEATHQIFRNRLHVYGGGSWFHEGVAEYMCTTTGERKIFARDAVKKGRFIPLREFVALPQVISGSGSVGGHAAYLQAASLVEFLRDSKWQPGKFPTFVSEMGRLARDDVAGVERKLREIYDADLDVLEAKWLEYWASK